MKEGLAATTLFDPLGSVEAELYRQLRTASTSQSRSIVVTADLSSDRSVNSAFLRWFLLEAMPASGLPISRVELQNAAITGAFNLSGATLGVITRFVNCTFDAEINLNDAKVIGIDFISGSATTILADRLSAEGSIRICALKDEESKQGPKIVQLRLCGANIRGNLDLRGCQLSGEPDKIRESVPLFADGLIVEGNALLSDGFAALGEVRLNGCKITRNLDCSGATLRNLNGYSLAAAGANISGSVYLCCMKRWSTYSDGRRFIPAPFISEGTVRFEGAKVEGDFDCSGGQFTAAAFRKSSSSTKPDRQQELDAILANGLSVGGDVILSADEESDVRYESFSHGAVSLISASVGGDLYLEGNFDFPGEEPISADGIVVAGTTFMDGMKTNGLLRLVQADLKQGLYVEGAKFDTGGLCRNWSEGSNLAMDELGGPSCGIYAPDANIGGTFVWKNLEKISNPDSVNTRFWLYTVGSKASTIEDHETSWRQLDRFDVTGCEYGTISDLTGDIGWRLAVLDGQYAIRNRDFRGNLAFACLLFWRGLHSFSGRDHSYADIEEARRRFKPQPYIQFAKVLRRAGYENAANEVLVQLERNRTRYSDFGALRQLGRWSLDWFLQYGFSPFRPVLIVLVWALFSAVFFDVAYYNKRIVAAKDNQYIPVSSSSSAVQAPSVPRVTFNPFIYAIDTLIPIVDFNQKKNWVVEPLSDQASSAQASVSHWYDVLSDLWRAIPLWGAGALLVFNTFFGWLMTTLFAAGVTGLLRAARES